MTLKRNLAWALFVLCLLLAGLAWRELIKEPNTLVLSQEAQAWIAQHPKVRIAFDGNFPPYSYLNDSGELVGLSVDLVRQIGERTGIDFQVDARTEWADLYAAAQQREVDVVATMVKTAERKEWFTFTQPYIYKSLMIMTRTDDQRINRREDLAGKKVALVEKYSYVPSLLAEFPSVQPVYVASMLDGLNALATGKADAAITFVGAGNYLQERYLLSNLQFAAVYDANSRNESFGVRSDWPELASILDQALASFSPQQKTALTERWVPSLAPEANWGLILLISLLFAVLMALAGLWLNYLQRQKAALRRVNEQAHSANQALQALKANLEVEVLQRTAALEMSRQALQTHRDHLEQEVLARTAELTARSQEGETLNRAMLAMLAMLEDLQELNVRYVLASQELAAANSHLQELDRLKSIFIASMSHELRTPLNTIIGFTGMIIDDMAGPVSEQQRGYLQRVQRASRHLLGLITDIIDVSKIDAGMLATEYSDFDLDAVLSLAREQIEPQAREKHLALVIAVPAGIHLHTDRKRLLQCLLNLLGNAVKYTQEGTVRVTAEVQEGQLVISVEDTGIGITEADVATLYRPFQRLESHLKILAGGSGLGLYLTQKLAHEVLGGHVSVISQLGQGSTFYLTLPLRAPAQQRATEDVVEAAK